MICVLKQDQAGKIVGWMMGVDTHDIRRRAQATLDHSLAELMYRTEFPPRGKTELPGGYTILVE